jgi:dethiobiotin synthetase
MTSLFVTSTGTEIGKTYVAALLCKQLISQGRSVAALKPILSGFEPDEFVASDSGVLLAALGQEVTLVAVEAMTPWRFTAPLSPDMAADREGRSIAFQPLMDFCQRGIDGPEEVTLIEGAGGVLAPIDIEHRMVDIPRVLNISAVLVVGSYLGTLSHTLTAYESLASRGIKIAGIVISESEVSPVPLSETKAAIERFIRDEPVVGIGRDIGGRGTGAETDLSFLLS